MFHAGGLDLHTGVVYLFVVQHSADGLDLHTGVVRLCHNLVM